jgi:putative chitinase
MIIDRGYFFTHTRSSVFRGYLTQSQVEGMNSILDGYEKESGGDNRQLAYIMATTFHETDQAMQPVRENNGRPYGNAKYWKSINGRIYYGRGYVQLTWDYNYHKMSIVTGFDLFDDPDLALRPDIAAKIMFYGMDNGSFTGMKLSDYINDKECDFVNARRIINGMDCATLIARYANEFLPGIKAESVTTIVTAKEG